MVNVSHISSRVFLVQFVGERVLMFFFSSFHRGLDDGPNIASLPPLAFRFDSRQNAVEA
jgi:hypothetical protein